MSGDGLVPPLNAPPAGQVVTGVQPGVSNAVIFANQVIVFGPSGSVSGIYLYAPGTTPGPGNPPVIALTSSPSDPFGNAITGGDQIVSTTPYLLVQDSSGRYIQLATISTLGAFLALGSADAGEFQPGILNAQVVGAGNTRQLSSTLASPQFNFAGQGASMQVLSGSADGASLGSEWVATANDGLASMGLKGDAAGKSVLQMGTGTQIKATSPTTGSPDGWNPVTVFTAPWANAAGRIAAQYRLIASPPNEVEIIGSVVPSAAAAAGATVFTLPAGYHPAHLGNSWAARNVTGAVTTLMTCDGSGNVIIENPVSASQVVDIHGFVSLDA